MRTILNIRKSLLPFLLAFVGTLQAQTTYYSKAAATDFNSTASWGINTDGSGASPASITNADNYIIQNNAALTLTANGSVRALTINGGSLTIAANTLTVAIASANNSTLQVSGGSLNVTGGTLNINGNLLIASGSNFNQSGGDINIDGNSGTLATSVAAGTNIFSVGSSTSTHSSGIIALSGGTLTIVDPHAATTGIAFHFRSQAGDVNATGHTFKFGDGVSATPGGNATSAFQLGTSINTSEFAFGNLIINGPYNANRVVTAGTTYGIYGDLTINAGGQYQTSTAVVSGNITVNGDGTSTLANNGRLITSGQFILASYASGNISPSTNPQTISGNGYFVNNATIASSTANFANLTINNTSAAGVTFANANTVRSVIAGLYTNTATISSSFQLTAGKLNIGSNTFTLGTATNSTGALFYTAGGFTGGTFRRWVGTAAITPTNGGAIAAGAFPFVSVNGESRLLQYGQTATVTTGGTVSVNYNDVAGQTAITPYTDNGISIGTRSNSNWVVATSGLVYGTGGTGLLKIRGDGYAIANITDARISGVSGVAPGTSGVGTNFVNAPEGNKNALTVANLTGTFYFATPAYNFIQSVTTGNWNNPSTWNCSCVPTSANDVMINNTHTVTIDATANAGLLTINSGGTLQSSANALTVQSSIHNIGTLNISGTGIVSLGTTDNDNAFNNLTGGSLNVTGGTLNINGNLLISDGANFNQSGGNINIDGNSGTLATSVAAGTNLFSVGTSTAAYASGTIALSGGILTIVDPHANAGSNGIAFYFRSSAGHVNAIGHTFRFGDGVSATSGGGNFGFAFQYNTAAGGRNFAFGNLIINGPYNANRFVYSGATSGILGDLTINAGGQYNPGDNGNSIYVNGNITVNGDGTSTLANNGRLWSQTTLYLAKFASGLYSPSTNAQTISGNGYFVNNYTLASSTANFVNLTINNTSTAGVTFANANTLTSVIPGLYTNTATVQNSIGSGTFSLTAGKINIGSNTFTLGTSAASPGTLSYNPFNGDGFTGGTFKRWVGTAAITPTTGGAIAAGAFPFISANGESRLFQYGQTATVTAGGTVSVTYNDVAGQTAITPYTDNGISIGTRSNSNWVVATGNGLTYGTGGTGILKIRGDGYVVDILDDVRLSGVSGIAPGASGDGTNYLTAPEGNKTAMAVANLNSTFYFATPNTIQSITTGNWNNPNTWSCNCVPTADNTVINNTHTVTIDATANAGSLTIKPGGTLQSSANTLTVQSSINNSGTINISGTATVKLGTTDNNNAFTNLSGGSLNVSGGTLNINGNLLISNGANFSQSGGNINIDANSGTPETSVATGTNIFAIGTFATPHATGTIALSGGTLTIIDPHASFTASACYFNSSAGHVNAIGHTFRFGDGISATAGGSSIGFAFNNGAGTNKLAFGNLIINGPYNASRYVFPMATSGILGDLTINAGGQFRINVAFDDFYVNGNITVNGDGTSTLANNGRLITSGQFILASYASGNISPSTNPQIISGNGYFVTNATIASSTANFSRLVINNTSAAGVTFANANSLRSVIPGLYTNTASADVWLQIVSGKINIGANTFTLGTSATSPGTLYYTAGGFTGGTFRRWVGTDAITPATGGAIAAGAFPFISASGESRMLQYGQTATVTTGGTVSVTYNNVAGQTAITPYTDNGVTIAKRSNSNWVVATSGIVYGTGGTGILKLRGDGYGVANVTDARISGVSGAAAGVSGAGTNFINAPEGNKSATTVANLAGTFYFATPAYNFIQSIATGNWTNPTTWNCSCVPTSTSDVMINSTHIVTVNATSNAKTLTINSGGTLQSSANILTVENCINNSGTINISGSGTVTLGTTDNDNPFTNLSGGSLNVSGGTLNINGNLLVYDGSNFNQSGGNINIDGNSGTLATSVAAGTNLFAVGTSTTPHATGTIALSGGTLTIIDPHAATSGIACYFNSSAGHVNSIGHTFSFGDGVSVTPGGNATSAFSHNTGGGASRFAFGNLIVNGPYNANRVVTAQSTQSGVLGDLTINVGGQYNLDFSFVTYVNGNITVNGVGTSTLANNGRLVVYGTLTLAKFESGVITASTNAQTISGNGYFVNNATIASSTANFNNLAINNTSAAGVTFANANSLSSVIPGLYTNTAAVSTTFTLTAGKINIGTNTFTLGISVIPPGYLNYTSGGFTGGTFKRWVGTAVITPTTGGAIAAGAFPFVSANGESRMLQYGQTATVTTGGTVSVTYNDVAGQTAITPYTDNGVSIAKRSNSNWVVATGNGLTYGTGTGILKIRGDGYAVTNVTDARISSATGAAAGTSGVSTNTLAAPEGNKTGMTLANLAGTFYFATPTTTIQTVATGNWTNPATWNCNCVPSGLDSVIVNYNHTVTIDATANAGALVIYGTIQASANTLTVVNRINNGGTVNISGTGTVTLGTTDNDNPFTNLSGGSLNVIGGTLNINGNLLISDAANFNQSGGNINIDGNSGTLATSVAAGTNIFAVGTDVTAHASGTIALSGGILTIVDPHAATTGIAFYFNSDAVAGHVNAIGHTFRFGDGVSATSGGNATSAFSHNAWVGNRFFAFGNLIINGPYNANRVVSPVFPHGVLGDLTINVGGQYNPSGGSIYVNGNITVNGDGTSTLANNGRFIVNSALHLAKFESGVVSPSTNAQTISGNGYFINNATIASSTANFGTLEINNISATGVTFANANTLTSAVPGLYTNTATITGTFSTFILTAGKINIGSNTFTLGTSAAQAGTLSYTAGGFTSGTFKRWVGTAAITPTTGGAIAAGAFPFISANGESRMLQYGQTATVTTGGTVAVTYNDVAGQTAITPYTDNGISIGKRSNANWVVATGNGLTYGSGGSGILKIRGDGYAVTNVTDARISSATGVAAGTSGLGTNTLAAPEGNKSAMTVANLAGTFYFALPPTGIIQSVATGNWTNPATWNCNCVPGGGDSVIVNNTHTVTIDATANAGALVINTGGTIQAAANTLTVVNRINNSGTVNISGTGTITLGTTDNDNPFTNLFGGSLNVSGGTLNINGNLLVSNGSNFNQSGGNINIDGNSGTVATSVAAGTDIFSIGTNTTPYNSGNTQFTGGTLTIIDPHAGTTGMAFFYYSTVGSVNATGHTLRFGDGISVTSGGNNQSFDHYSGFNTNTTLFSFGNLIINGPYNNFRRCGGSSDIILGDLIINQGGQYNPGFLFANGNITVNGDGSSVIANNGALIIPGFLLLQNGPSSPSNNAQTISGNGYFVNNATIASSTANFGNLTINNTSTAGVTFANANTLTSVISGLYTNTATVPGTGTFTLTAGKLNIGSNTFTLGTSAASPGSFSYIAGGFTGGTFRRWVGTAAITPTTGGSIAAGAFPFISSVGESRWLQYGQTDIITSGGTVSVTYNDVAGQTAITPYTDNGVSISKRSNSNWVVATGNGLTYGTGTGLLKIRGDGYVAADFTDVRISAVNGIATGTSVAGTNTLTAPEGNKTAMTVANLSGTFYFATPVYNLIQSVATGNWTNPATWDCFCVPTGGDSVIVNNTHTVTVDATANARILSINTGGTIQAAANTLTVVNRINNSGTVNISGTGTITLGTTDNDNPFTNLSNGTLNVSGGTLNINGNLLIASGSNFSQSGGNINIDGNSGTVATSVAAGTDIFSIGTFGTPHASGTIALSGGTLTIVDPHAATTGIAFYFRSSAGHVNAIGHTFRFGDGVSATPGGNATSAFMHNTAAGITRFAFGNLTINGPYNANRVVTAASIHGILGDLTINAGGQYNPGQIYVNGNITVNGDGTSNLANNGRLVATSTLGLGNYQSGVVSPSTNAQTISGSGYFLNNATIASSTANFRNLEINNTSAAGVTFANANSLTSVVPGLYTNTAAVSGTFTLIAGKLNIGSNTFTLGTSAASPGAFSYAAGGFTGGTFRRWVGTTAITPTTGGAVNRGAFPFISANSESRLLQYGQTATVTTGGTVSVTYNDVAGQTAITPYTDNGISIGKRSNSNWVVATGNGLTYGTGGTGILKIRGDGYTIGNATDARISSATGIAAGTSSAGTNTLTAPEGNKSAMTISDLNGTFYFATPIYTYVQSVATGNWTNPATWDCNCVPSASSDVQINNTHTVTIDAAANARTLTLNAGGLIQSAANTLTVTNWINNSGVVNISGSGTVTLGTTTSNNPFNNLTGGSLNVSGGTLNINGNLLISDGANFNQSGGNINIDGNSGTLATSVTAGTDIFSIGTFGTPHASGTIALSGGTLTIVDPHAATTGIAFYFRSSAGHVNAIGHTFRFGDGVSATPGGNATSAFQYNTSPFTSKFAFGNVIINGPYNTNRIVVSGEQSILGDFTVNTGGQYLNAGTIYLNGNITVNGDGSSTLANNGRLMITGTLYLGNYQSGVLAPSTNAQTISGNGYFVNDAIIAFSAANFRNLEINNTSAAGVTFANANSLTSVVPGLYTNTAAVSGIFTLTSGKINIGANTFTLGTSAAFPGFLSYTSGGFTGGTFKRWVGTAAITPTTGGAIAAGAFPFISANGESRLLQYGQTTTVTSGGTVSVTYNDVAGQTAITPYIDNGVTIAKRSNSNWVVATGNGLAYGTGTGILKIRGDGYAVTNVTDARISGVSGAAAGTSGVGTNTFAAPEGNKSAMTVANLAGTFYFATPSCAPPVPVANTTTPGCSSFTASWSNVGATGYLLFVATDTLFTNLVTGYDSLYVGGGATSYNVNTNLLPGQTYYYRVKGFNSSTCISNASNFISVTIPSTTVAPTFTAGATTICANGTDTYTATATVGTVTYSIVGGTSASINATTGVLSSAGTANFTVRATSTGTCGGPFFTDRIVEVTPTTVAPTFTAGATTICANGTDTYTATATVGSVTYSIVGGTGATINATTGVLSSAGTANFTVRATSTGTCGGPFFTDRAVTVTPTTVAPTFTAGATTICANGTDTYTATSTVGTVSYSIVGGSGASINATTGVLSSAGTANFTVRATSTGTCGGPFFTDRAVTVTPTTVAPTFTAGATTICANGTDTYTATATVGTVTYSIVGGTGASINATTGVLSSAGTTNFTVRATSTGTCGGPFSTDRAVTVNPLPNQPGAFTTSSSSLCAATTSITYALTNDPTVSYNWSYSGLNASINGTGNSVTVDFANNATSGTLSVTATNGCGTSTARTIAITINPIPDLQITVPAAVCAPGTVNITTGVVVDANGTTGTLSYFPTLTDATNGTNALSNPSAIAVSGIYYIKKTATVGGCIDINAVAVTVNSLPGAAGNITGTAAVCQGQTGVIYTVPAITNATGYTWILPSGTTITAGFNTNSITVSYSNSATSGNITVRGTNSCGNGTISANFAVTVDALPATVVATAGTGATYYSINANWGAVANNISYILEVSDVSDFSSSGVFYAYVGNVTSYTVLQLNPNTTYYYRIYATNLCGVASVSNTIAYTTLPIVTGPLTWNGSVSTDWNDANNWTPNTIPTTLDDVIVPNVTNDPALITGANGNIKDINISSGATVTIGAGKTLDVKGNWSGTTTTIVSGAGKTIFSGTSGAQTITGGGTFSTLQINNTNGATIASGGNFVNVTTALELKAGTLTTNGNLKTISITTGTAYINDFSSGFTGSLSGLVSVERFIPPSPNGFRYIGQPVNTGAGVMAISAMQGFTVTGVPGQTIPLPTCSPSNLAPNSPYGNLMYFQENGPYGSPACRQRGWWYQTTGNLTVGRGYGIKQGGNTKITYRGTANTGTITSSATNTHTSVFTPAGNNGWNLVSNPYPSAITIDEMGTNTNTANDMPAGFDKQIQFYITGNTNLTGSYQTYNVAISGAANIALGQGFWVRVTTPGTTPAWTLGQGHRTTSSPTYFDVNPQIESHLKVNVSGNGFADLSNIYFVNGAESGLDIYDGNKWSSATGQPTLYTKAGEEVMGINSLPSLSETMAVPMGLTPGANGNFTFTFEDIASFPQTAMIYLEDLKLGTMNNLRDNATYEFAANLNDNPDRFMLHFQPGLQAEVADQDCESQGSIELTQPAPTVWSTYEVKGNDNNVYATGTNLSGTVTVSNLPAQEYVVTVTHPSGYSAQEYITVNGSNPINATINASATNVQIDEMISLTANATNASEYVWNFGDGNTQTGSANVVHAYDAAGTYNVTLTATNDVCNDIAVKTINVTNTTTGINGTAASNLNIYGQGERVVIEFNKWGGDKADIFMYNTLGQRMESLTGVSTLKGRQELYIADIKPGYYFIQVVSNGKILGKKVFLGKQ